MSTRHWYCFSLDMASNLWSWLSPPAPITAHAFIRWHRMNQWQRFSREINLLRQSFRCSFHWERTNALALYFVINIKQTNVQIIILPEIQTAGRPLEDKMSAKCWALQKQFKYNDLPPCFPRLYDTLRDTRFKSPCTLNVDWRTRVLDWKALCWRAPANAGLSPRKPYEHEHGSSPACNTASNLEGAPQMVVKIWNGKNK